MDVVIPTSYAETLSSLDKWQILLGHISVIHGSSTSFIPTGEIRAMTLQSNCETINLLKTLIFNMERQYLKPMGMSPVSNSMKKLRGDLR